LSIGFSLAAEGILRAHLPVAPGGRSWQSSDTVGFLIVMLGRQQLFTELRSRTVIAGSSETLYVSFRGERPSQTI
jgi:hypothetical protein